MFQCFSYQRYFDIGEHIHNFVLHLFCDVNHIIIVIIQDNLKLIEMDLTTLSTVSKPKSLQSVESGTQCSNSTFDISTSSAAAPFTPSQLSTEAKEMFDQLVSMSTRR